MTLATDKDAEHRAHLVPDGSIVAVAALCVFCGARVLVPPYECRLTCSTRHKKTLDAEVHKSASEQCMGCF